MYLAIKEMKKERLRFFMIVLVTALIAYLVYFLSSLSYGLAQINRTAIDHWNAQGVVLSKASNGNIYGSMIEERSMFELGLDSSTAINVTSSPIYINNVGDPYDLFFMGYELSSSKITPELKSGRSIQTEEEIVISNNFKDMVKVDIGDFVVVASTGKEYKVVGFVEDSNYNTIPVAYVMRNALQPESKVNAFISYESIDQNKLDSYDLVYFTTAQFIKDLPGYQPQVLTFGLMIFSLSLISAIIIGIFMYILTMQKKAIFGVLKVQGFRNGYIMTSVIYQSVILTMLGFMMGLGFTILTVELLPSSVPVAYYWDLYLIITVFSIVSSLVGSLFSAKSILKIDPLEAL